MGNEPTVVKTGVEIVGLNRMLQPDVPSDEAEGT